MEKVLKVKGLNKSFKSSPFSKPHKVLHNISFELTSGIMTGFLGINGSGKTTTIKCLLELIQKDSGEILFFNNQKLSNDVKRRIAYLPEKPQLYEHLTGEEFLTFALRLSGKNINKSVIDETLELVELKQAKKLRLREYSKGMYQRMGLAQSLIRSPEFVILDEPMSDLDPAGRSLVKDILKRIKSEKNVSIFISSHLLQDIEDLCSDIVILNQGEVKYNGATLSFINKLNPQFEIQFEENQKINTMLATSEEELQLKIDSLRKNNINILQIQNQKSLEEAFKNLISKY